MAWPPAVDSQEQSTEEMEQPGARLVDEDWIVGFRIVSGVQGPEDRGGALSSVGWAGWGGLASHEETEQIARGELKVPRLRSGALRASLRGALMGVTSSEEPVVDSQGSGLDGDSASMEQTGWPPWWAQPAVR